MNRDQGTSIVVPTFRSSETLESLVIRVLQSVNGKREVIIVDDGNTDGTWEQIKRIASLHDEVKGIRLCRNFGQHSALIAGIRVAKYPIVVTIDDDLQNPPEEIPKLLAAIVAEVDVVYGVSNSIQQSGWRKLASRVVKVVFAKALGFESAVSSSSFRAFRTRLREGFSGDLGPSVSLDALLTWSTNRFSTVDVEHHQRRVGKSNYSFAKLTRFMLDTVTSYSTIPLRIATSLGFVTTLFGVFVLFWVFGNAIFASESVPGFPFLAASVAIFSGVQLVVLGIIGEYLGKIHFRAMNKPTYTVSETTEN